MRAVVVARSMSPGTENAAEDDPVEERVGEALRETDATVAVAESCTGGLICSMLTDVPGSSDYLDRGFVTYAYDAKRESLGVTREALDAHGAVSEPVARQMARAARDVSDVTWGLATTGVAGPSGGSEETPVGTVYVGVAYAGPWGTESSYATVSRHEFDGSRTEIKARIARQALADLLEELGRGHPDV
jgi:nicotinamide-nucleotide amidase